MKALILAGGKGTRLRPLTFSMAKQLVPVANKPVVEFGLESIVEAGVVDIGVIVGDTAEAIMEALGDGSRWNCHLTYIPQDAPKGLADAVRTAQSFLGDDDFIMYLGDNIIKSSVADLIEDFEAHRPAASILLCKVPNPQDFGVAEMANDHVVSLQEKPTNPKSDLALVGVYLFSKAIHDAIATLRPSARGEYEITDAIQGLINHELPVRSRIVQGWWKDTGTVEAMLEANRMILTDLEASIHATSRIDSDSRLEGPVVVGANSTIENCTLRGPLIIGANCHLKNAFIGPFTSISDRCEIIDSEVEHSILLEGCIIFGLESRLESSLLGREVRVTNKSKGPRTTSLVMGDSSSAEIS